MEKPQQLKLDSAWVSDSISIKLTEFKFFNSLTMKLLKKNAHKIAFGKVFIYLCKKYSKNMKYNSTNCSRFTGFVNRFFLFRPVSYNIHIAGFFVQYSKFRCPKYFC